MNKIWLFKVFVFRHSARLRVNPYMCKMLSLIILDDNPNFEEPYFFILILFLMNYVGLNSK